MTGELQVEKHQHKLLGVFIAIAAAGISLAFLEVALPPDSQTRWIWPLTRPQPFWRIENALVAAESIPKDERTLPRLIDQTKPQTFLDRSVFENPNEGMGLSLIEFSPHSLLLRWRASSGNSHADCLTLVRSRFWIQDLDRVVYGTFRHVEGSEPKVTAPLTRNQAAAFCKNISSREVLLEFST